MTCASKGPPRSSELQRVGAQTGRQVCGSGGGVCVTTMPGLMYRLGLGAVAEAPEMLPSGQTLIPKSTHLIGPRGVEYRTARLRAESRELRAAADIVGVLTASRKPRQGSVSGYDVYGLVRAGDSGTSRHKFVGSLGHTSEDETGLIYMRARWMDPSLGRFISEDPARDGANWFEYVRSRPTQLRDRTGRFVDAFVGSRIGMEFELAQALRAVGSFSLVAALLGTVYLALYAVEQALDGVYLSHKADIAFIDHLCHELHLTRDQRRRLHDAISKWHYTADEIRQTAEDIAGGGEEGDDDAG